MTKSDRKKSTEHGAAAKKDFEDLFKGFPGVSQAEWARFLGVSATSVSQWRAGQQGMSDAVSNIVRILLKTKEEERKEIVRVLRAKGSAEPLQSISSAGAILAGVFGAAVGVGLVGALISWLNDEK